MTSYLGLVSALSTHSDRERPVAAADRLVRGWRDQNRRASAPAWLYHLGLDSFSAMEHWQRGPRVRSVLVAALVRDLASSLLIWRTRTNPQRVAVAASAFALATDAAAGAFLVGDITRDDFARDRVLSQFGLSSAWTLRIALPENRLVKGAGFLAPIALQLFYARLWRLSARETANYVLREGLWSTASLLAVGRLSNHMAGAVEQGTAAAETLASRLRAEIAEDQRLNAEQAAHDDILQTGGPLVGFERYVEVAEMELDRPPVVRRLSESERERLRAVARHGSETELLTVASLAWRLIAARVRASDTFEWIQRDDNPHADLLVVPSRPYRDLIVFSTDRANGHFVVETEVVGRSLLVTIEADDLPTDTRYDTEVSHGSRRRITGSSRWRGE